MTMVVLLLFLMCAMQGSALFTPQGSKELKDAVIFLLQAPKQASAKYGAVNTWNVAFVDNISFLFKNQRHFNEDISCWNTARVTSMRSMFQNAATFNQPIGDWNTGQVTTMEYMFFSATVFNQPIGDWNTARVTSMRSMFQNAATFNQPIGDWSIGQVTTMRGMFRLATTFNQPIGDWNTGQVTAMQSMFDRATTFNQPIGDWNIGQVTTVRTMFGGAKAFNQPIGDWNTGQVTEMQHMFRLATTFNQPIGDWNTGQVTTMEYMFFSATVFNQPIGDWNTARVTKMQYMFYGAGSFNQGIGNWNVRRVQTMCLMFRDAATFDQCLDAWDTSQVNASGMLQMFVGSRWNRCAPCSDSVDRIAQIFIIMIVCAVCLNAFVKMHILRSHVVRIMNFCSRCQRRGPRLHSVVTWEVLQPGHADPLAIGREVHHRVLPHRWCITRTDLILFEEEVYLAWKDGKIPNNEQFPNPYHDDASVGPTMYAVNEHFIKPLTAQYGGMSFALMLHPEGLECDVFATHAWAEGVFEFCDKVKRGWPRDCENMYICFLSNPQNLDISDLLDVPIEQSPFALALSKASRMLVVPNRFVSIYTRLWCCYEAFVAYVLDKAIILTPAKVFVAWVYRRLCLCAFAMMFTFLGITIFYKPLLYEGLSSIPSWRPEYRDALDSLLWRLLVGLLVVAPPVSLFSACVMMTYFSAESRSLAFLHWSVSTAAGGCAGVSCLLFNAPTSENWIEKLDEAAVVGCVYLFFAIGISLFTIVHILRCRTEEARLQEASQLFFDKLSAAGCSNVQDKLKILKVLESKESEVEEALRTLMSQGMSTAQLRRAAASHVGQGYADIGTKMFALILWPSYFAISVTAGMYLEQRVGRRIVVLSFFSGLISYYICVWATLRCDIDLSNLIMRASVVAWGITLASGLLMGLWAIAVGVPCAAFYVAYYSDHIQATQMLKLYRLIKPISILCLAFTSWESISTALFGIGCPCIWQDVCGFLFCLMSTAAFLPLTEVSASTMFLMWACGNSLVVLANMLLTTNHKFFFADAQMFHLVIPQKFHYMWGSLNLVLVCIVPLIMKMRRHVSGAAQARPLIGNANTSEDREFDPASIEMQLLHA